MPTPHFSTPLNSGENEKEGADTVIECAFEHPASACGDQDAPKNSRLPWLYMAQTYQRQKRIGFPDRPAPAGFLFRLPCFRHSEQRIEPCRQVKPNLTDKSQPDAPICGQTSEQVCKSTGSSFYNSTARHRHTAAPEIAQIPTIRETPHQKPPAKKPVTPRAKII